MSAEALKKRRAVFLDRDGICNRAPALGQYLLHLNEFILHQGIGPVVRYINDLGWLAIIISNQQCLEKGLLLPATLEAMTDRLHQHLAGAGAALDAVYYCPHRAERQCLCRKPRPGMILEAAERFKVDLKRSFMIGDRSFDVLAGEAAGCRTIFLQDGDRNQDDLRLCRPDFIIHSLEESIPIFNGEHETIRKK